MNFLENISLAILLISVLLIVYSYAIYPFILALLAKIAPRKNLKRNGAIYTPSVSVLIAAHNEEKVIEEKIKNTLDLDYPKDKIEILIGSDGSEDRTDEICKKYTDTVKLKRIEPRQGKANVLNTLVPMAEGEIILFSDANTLLETDSLKKLTRYFTDDSIGGVCGMLVLESRKETLESYEKVYWKYDSRIKFLESHFFSIIGSNGGIYAIRKGLYKAIPKDTIIDDFWISIQVLEQRKRICFEQDAVAYEYVSDTMIDEFWRKVRIGAGNLQTFIRKPIIANQNSFVQVAYYSHKVIRWAVPFLLLFAYFSILILSNTAKFVFVFYLCNFIILLTLLGVMLEFKNKTINLMSYFILFNTALFFGYMRYVFGKQNVTWRRAER